MALTRKVRGAGPRFPLNAVDANGGHRLEGTLTAMEGNRYLWEPASGGDAMESGHLPWFVRTLAPEGFLGRLQARRWSAEIPVPPSLADWGDDDFLVAFQFVHLDGDALIAAAQQENPVLPAHFRQCLRVTQKLRQIIEGVVIAHPFGGTCFADTGQCCILEIKYLLDHD